MKRLAIDGYDEVYRFECAGNLVFLSLHAVVAGRSFGGMRFMPYSSERAALDDALALSRAMSRKVVMSGVEGGGGKTVIMDCGGDRGETVRRVGAFIESLGGRYHTGGDLGFGPDDIQTLRAVTQYVARGDLETPTAATVVSCMTAVCEVGSVAIQGMGGIGSAVATELLTAGVRVVACDVSETAWPADVERVSVDGIYGVACDVFAPCAVGGVLNAETIEKLRCKVVCGGANNPFASESDFDRLRTRGIGAVPDFISNCGATIVGASTVLGEEEQIASRMSAVPALAREIVDEARDTGRSAQEIAVEMADARLAASRT